MIFVKLAWRNVLRNKRRTLLSASAIGIGIATMIFTDAMMIGWKDLMIKNATSTFMGEAQIHHKTFREMFETEKTIPNHREICSKLNNEPKVKSWSSRTQSFAMISSAANSYSIAVTGLDPIKERPISKIDDNIKVGKFLQGNDKNSILIGHKLADILEVELGDKVVVTVANAESGDMSQEMFRIRGIFDFGIREMDRNMAFIPLCTSQELFGIGDKINEIVILFNNLNLKKELNLPFWSELKMKEEIAAESWLELQPELGAVLEMIDYSIFILGAILFLVVAADIINTLFMSLYERMYEFGILRAVGTRSLNLGKLILLESACLALISSVIGIAAGFVITYYFSQRGIDYSGTEFVSVSMDFVYPVLKWNQFVIYPIVTIFFTVITGLYPAFYATRMKVAKTLKAQF